MFSHFLRGDFRHFYSENISDFSNIPQAWDSSLNTGLGISQLGSLWITSYLNITSFLHETGLSWDLISLFFWVLPAVVLSFISSSLLFRNMFPDFQKRFAVISGFIYVGNTYFLMVLTGGQLGVSLAYSLAPLVLLGFIKLIDKPGIRNALISGFVLSIQTLFDPRIVYLTIASVVIYSLFNFDKIRKIKDKIYLPVPFLVCILLNAFWIIPLILARSSPIPQGFNSALGFEFFSFAPFSHALSLLHPNFPENIFGKTYFLRPEFLFLPILAFSSLLFKARREILYFALLAMLGIFLAKGVNEPFGFFNKFLFESLPGMQIFRDPTKFYLLIALSYSVLIPFSVYSFTNWISKFSIFNFQFSIKSTIFNFQNVFLIFTILYLIFLIRPLWLGEQREIFKSKEIPKEYTQLKDFLYNQEEYFRTLWIPQWQRFGYFSNNHPAIGREEVLKGDYKDQIAQLHDPASQQLLKNLSVKYIIIPYDSEGEIFLAERKYDHTKFEDAVKRVEDISWLRRINTVPNLAIFEVDGYQGRFTIAPKGAQISYKSINPTEYIVYLQGVRYGDILIFSESYNPGWIATTSKIRVENSPAGLTVIAGRRDLVLLQNSFILPMDGNYELKIYYEPQKWVNIGLIISGATVLIIFGLFLFKKKEER